MIGATGSVRPIKWGITGPAILSGKQLPAKPKHASTALAFGSNKKPPRSKPPEKPRSEWEDQIARRYEKLGLAGKILFFVTVPGASVFILFMERKRLITWFRRWRNS